MTGKTASLILALIAWCNVIALSWYVLFYGASPVFFGSLALSAGIGIFAGANAGRKDED